MTTHYTDPEEELITIQITLASLKRILVEEWDQLDEDSRQLLFQASIDPMHVKRLEA